MKSRKKRPAPASAGQEQLRRISAALTEAYRGFNSTSDPVVMDACIFEINALRARRNSVLKALRAEEGMDSPH